MAAQPANKAPPITMTPTSTTGGSGGFQPSRPRKSKRPAGRARDEAAQGGGLAEDLAHDPQHGDRGDHRGDEAGRHHVARPSIHAARIGMPTATGQGVAALPDVAHPLGVEPFGHHGEDDGGEDERHQHEPSPPGARHHAGGEQAATEQAPDGEQRPRRRGLQVAEVADHLADTPRQPRERSPERLPEGDFVGRTRRRSVGLRPAEVGDRHPVTTPTTTVAGTNQGDLRMRCRSLRRAAISRDAGHDADGEQRGEGAHADHGAQGHREPGHVAPGGAVGRAHDGQGAAPRREGGRDLHAARVDHRGHVHRHRRDGDEEAGHHDAAAVGAAGAGQRQSDEQRRHRGAAESHEPQAHGSGSKNRAGQPTRA